MKNIKISRIATSVILATSVGINQLGWAQETSEQDGKEEIEKVVVTGSHIARTELEGPQSLTIITSEDMKKRGEVTVFDSLKNLSQNSTFQFEGPESQLFTPDVQTINLRGAGVGNTLVLINGRRPANYPAAYQSTTSVFNYASIPQAAVERIEVLSTGASAIYGSDAVAGVVNIILKKDIDETTLDFMVGTPTETKSARWTKRFQLVTGKAFEKGAVTGIFQYQERDGIQGKHLDDYDNEVEDFPYGTGIVDRTVVNLNYWRSYFGGDGGGDPYVDPGEDTCAAMENGTEYSYREGSGYYCGRDGIKGANFRNDSRNYSVFVDGNYTLDNGIELFGNLTYYNSESTSNNDSIYISEDILDLNTVVDSGVIGDYYNWYLAQRGFTEQELGMSLDQEFKEYSYAFSGGAKGQFLGTHDWEVAVTHSAYKMDSKMPWWKSDEVINTFLGDYYGFGFFGDAWWGGNGTFGLTDNLYSQANDDVRNAIGNQTYGNKTSSTSIQLTLNGDLMSLPAGPLSYAVVMEYEKQKMELIPDERIKQDAPIDGLTGSGWWKLTGYQGKGDRERTALGAELRIPVFETLTVNAAARVDSYDSQSSSIGTRFTPSVSVEYRPIERVLVRSGYAESYRAPDMNYVFTDSGAYTTAYDYVQCYEQYVFQNGSEAGFDRNDCDSSTVFRNRTGSQNLGEDALKDETGYSRWLGISVDVTDDLKVTLDYSELYQKDKVVTEGTSQLLRDEFSCFTGELSGERCTYVSNRIKRKVDDSTGISYIDTFNVTPVNQAETTFKYLDATLEYDVETSMGDFSLDVSYTHLLEQLERETSDSEEIDIRDDEYLGGWNPRSVITTSLGYNYDRFSAAFTNFRIGSTTTWNPDLREEGDSYRVGAYSVWNLTAKYEYSTNMSFAVTVNNVFDEHAPKDKTFQFYEDPWYNYYVYSGSAIGREVYANLTYTF